MDYYTIKKLGTRARSGMAGWRRRRAAERLAAENSLPAVEALARALEFRDERVVAIARAALIDLTDQATIDAACEVWLRTRTAVVLGELLTEQGWVASQPASLRVATALHGERLEALANGDPGVARALLIAAADVQRPVHEASQAREALTALQRADARDAVCAAAIGGNPTALEAAIAGNFATDPGQRAVLLFLAGEFDRYTELDFDGSLLRGALTVADKGLRRRLADKARVAGRVEWVRAIAGDRQARQLGELSEHEWETTISVLVATENWEQLWRVALEAPPLWGVQMLRELGQRGLAPTSEDERAGCAALIELAGACNAEPYVLRGHKGPVMCLAGIADSKLLVSGSSDTTARLWQLPSGRPTRTLEGHAAGISCLAVTPDGRQLAAAGRDGTIQLWNLPSGSCTDSLTCIASVPDIRGSLSCLTVTPDGGLLVGGTTGFRENCSLYTVEHEVPDSYDVLVNNIVFEQRERISYEAVGMLEWWSLPSGKPIQTLDCSGQVQCLTVTPDGGLLIAGINEDGGETISPLDAKLWGTVQLWHMPSGLPASKWEGTGVVSCLAVTPDGALLATGSYDRTVRLWHLPSGKPAGTLTGHTDGITCLAITPDGTLLGTGSYDRTVRLWHLPSGKPAGTLTGHTDGISCLAITPDGTLLGTGSYDRTVRLWRLRSEVARRKPIRDISSAEVQHLRQSYGALRPVDQAWVELITALVLRHRRHDIEVVDAPHKVAGECDVELDG